MLIEELKLTNVLSFGPDSQPFALGPLNLIIGANGSGKSNLLEAVELLRQAPERRGFHEFLRKAALKGPMPKIVACGGRLQADKLFAQRCGRERTLPCCWSIARSR
jgi:predicted ATPase